MNFSTFKIYYIIYEKLQLAPIQAIYNRKKISNFNDAQFSGLVYLESFQ